MRGLIGKKIGMTQIFNDGGQAIPVTVVEGGPCVVTQVKTDASDGYDAIQVGYGERKNKHSNKALNGHFEKAKTDVKRVLAEFVPVPDYEYKTGQEFGVSLFKEGEYESCSFWWYRFCWKLYYKRTCAGGFYPKSVGTKRVFIKNKFTL